MDTYDEIEQAIVRAGPSGADISDIVEMLGGRLTGRQIRYRIDKLIDNGRVQTTGERRWRRYFVSSETHDATPVVSSMFGTYAAALIARTNERLSERPLASYDDSLLGEYRPNEIMLLPAGVLSELHQLGATPDSNAQAGTFARHVMERLVIDLSWASSNLEGNTYSLLDTQRLIELGEAADGKDLRETQMILNHKRAIEFLVDDVPELVPRARLVNNLHAILLENLLAEPANAGRVRQRPVGITSSTYTPLSNPHRLTELFHRMLALAREIEDPLEQGFFLFVHIAYLQPYIDGNKRTARLAANIPLIRSNMRPLTFVDVPRDEYLAATLAFYETAEVDALRDIWVWAYRRSCARYEHIVEAVAEPDPFRMKFRAEIYEAVHDIVVEPPDDVEAEVDRIANSRFEDSSERARFVGFVMADLSTLHDGNFMRYRISPAQFERWKET